MPTPKTPQRPVKVIGDRVYLECACGRTLLVYEATTGPDGRREPGIDPLRVHLRHRKRRFPSHLQPGNDEPSLGGVWKGVCPEPTCPQTHEIDEFALQAEMRAALRKEG